MKNNSMVRKSFWALLTLLLLIVPCWAKEKAASQDIAIDTDNPALSRWTKKDTFSEKTDAQTLSIKVVYYSREYIEALVKSEAEKNLWTKDEMENYKYTLLKTLNLHDSIPFRMEFYVTGVPMYLQPFDRNVSLFIGKKRYYPSDYDKRFNFKVLGERDGMVFFPRFDPKTGKDLLADAKDVRLVLNGGVSQATAARGSVKWVWDISKDNPEALGAGKAMDRLELDRLIKRLAKLTEEKQKLQSEMDAVDDELQEVQTRVEQLQSK